MQDVFVIKFGKHGRSFGTREDGRRFRELISEALDDGKFTVFDFSGVEIVSNAFADEVFGKLVKNFGLDELRKNSSFKDAHQEVALVVQKAINDHLAA